jgi:hypothetical protein
MMKLIDIKIMKKVLVVLLGIVVVSCADPNLEPIVTFENAGKGAYPRKTAEAGEQLVNILTQADFDASQYSYSLRFIDEAKGGNVATFVLNAEYVDVTGANSQDAKELKTYAASTFGTDENGYKTLDNVTVTGPELAGAFNLAYADLNAGDQFRITGELVMTSGAVFAGSNSSATVQGAAFQGQFDFNMAVGCPSDLTGTFDYSTDLTPGGWAGDAGNTTVTGQVDIEALGGGAYTFSDWSFGGYLEVYGCCSASGEMKFTDVCTVVTFEGGADSYGDNWAITVSIPTATTLLVEYRNDYAGGYEGGNTTITFPGGVPFTLAP